MFISTLKFEVVHQPETDPSNGATEFGLQSAENCKLMFLEM